MGRIVEFRHDGKGHQVANAHAKLARLAAALNAGANLARVLPSLVLMTDDERLPDALRAARMLPRGSLVVLRSRDALRRHELAAGIAKIARRRGLVLLVAGDPGLAVRINADGIHLPEIRAGEIAAWRARRPSWFITAAAHSLGAAARAARLGADAVFVSPVFPTQSHPGRAALTPIGLRPIARLVPGPIYALGGINANNAARLAGARLAGLAAIDALAV
jgi:thiamine-phosphate pyrophosphorylase